MVWVEDKEKTPLSNAKSLTGYIIQTIENHMLYPLEHGQQVADQKENLERIRDDLSRLNGILREIE